MFALCSAAEVADCQSNQHQTDQREENQRCDTGKSGIVRVCILHGLLLGGVRAVSLCHALCGSAGTSEVEELGDFEADTELEELEGLTSWEWSSSVLLRERYPATQSAAPGMESFEPLLAAIRPRVVPPERNGSSSSPSSLSLGALLGEELEDPEEELEDSKELPGRGSSMEMMTSSPETS